MKYSRQREQILEFVKSVKTHPTAETVYNEVRKENPKISLGTVYRNLVLLSEQGNINRIRLGETKDRFDGDTSYHYHAICTKCGNIVDVSYMYLKDIDIEVSNIINQKILSHNIVFHTICKDCDN